MTSIVFSFIISMVVSYVFFVHKMRQNVYRHFCNNMLHYHSIKLIKRKEKIKMIGISNNEIIDQFKMTMLLMDKPRMFQDFFIVNGNDIYLLAGTGTVHINLNTGKLDSDKITTENLITYQINKNMVAWGMCNMINNALQQWIGVTPFCGEDVCRHLSMEATKALRPFSLSLKLTPNYMRVFDKSESFQISYEKAILKTLKK